MHAPTLFVIAMIQQTLFMSEIFMRVDKISIEWMSAKWKTNKQINKLKREENKKDKNSWFMIVFALQLHVGKRCFYPSILALIWYEIIYFWIFPTREIHIYSPNPKLFMYGPLFDRDFTIPFRPNSLIAPPPPSCVPPS